MKNLIIAIIVIVLIIVGVVYYVNQDEVDIINEGTETEVIDQNGEGSFTTEGNDTTLDDAEMNDEATTTDSTIEIETSGDVEVTQ